MSIKDSRKEAMRLRAAMQQRRRDIEKATLGADECARRGDARGAEREQDKIRYLTEEMMELENAALHAEGRARQQEKRIADIEARMRVVEADYKQKMSALAHEKNEIIGDMTNMY